MFIYIYIEFKYLHINSISGVYKRSARIAVAAFKSFLKSVEFLRITILIICYTYTINRTLRIQKV